MTQHNPFRTLALLLLPAWLFGLAFMAAPLAHADDPSGPDDDCNAFVGVSPDDPCLPPPPPPMPIGSPAVSGGPRG